MSEMDDFELTMIGRGRDALEAIADPGSFEESNVSGFAFEHDYGVCALLGDARLDGEPATFIVNDAEAFNEKFPVVFAGIIGLEEACKMASAVYLRIEADRGRPISEKRPIVLIVDTPGNAPGKLEEIIGMNKATGSYQLALAEARKAGHPVVAIVIGRAISGGFLCHGLQADRILALSKDFGTTVHVMPLTSIARITKMDIERLEELSADNPVFASGVDDFYKLGGIDEIVPDTDMMREAIIRGVKDVRALKAAGKLDELGPRGRAARGKLRGGRCARAEVFEMMAGQFHKVMDGYLD